MEGLFLDMYSTGFRTCRPAATIPAGTHTASLNRLGDP